jgi:hypothetical protein
MRFYEFKTIKPLSPAQMRIHTLQQQVERSRRALSAEREQQRTRRERERQQLAANKMAGRV